MGEGVLEVAFINEAPDARNYKLFYLSSNMPISLS
jgi:hypothetical protein